MSRKLFALLFCSFLYFCLAADNAPAGPQQDGTLPALTAIAGNGMIGNHAYSDLQELSDDIGARLTASPSAARAVEWGMAKMRAMGLENVHAEHWQISHGWTRGVATAEMTAPLQRALMVDSMGWTGSTRGTVEADVVPVNTYQLDEEMKDNASKWRGKILVTIRKGDPPANNRNAFANFGKFLKAAHEAGAAALIGGQGGSPAAGMHLTHTGVMGFDTYYELPIVSMVAEDQEQIVRFLDAGRNVRLRMNVQNKVTAGPADAANAVGEIRGTQNPEQIIVVGGHLDSWDLAQGTTDNGCGTVTTLGAAEAIMKSGFKPKRTIRFVLFTGEEQGLLGSFAYTKQHKSEIANHVATVILDNGQGAVTGLNMGGRADLLPAMRAFTDTIKSFGALKVDDEVEFGTDTGPFTLEGLPGINMAQDSPEYRYTHHSPVDTFDKVKPDLLQRDTTIVALTAFWIASRPDRLDSPWSPEQTAKMLVDKHMDEELKAFGVWPFGDLGKEKKD